MSDFPPILSLGSSLNHSAINPQRSIAKIFTGKKGRREYSLLRKKNVLFASVESQPAILEMLQRTLFDQPKQLEKRVCCFTSNQKPFLFGVPQCEIRIFYPLYRMSYTEIEKFVAAVFNEFLKAAKQERRQAIGLRG